MTTPVEGPSTSLSNTEKIALTTSAITLLALMTLASTGIRASHPMPWLKMGRRASLITTCAAGGGLVLLLGAFGLRALFKQKSQPSYKGSTTNNIFRAMSYEKDTKDAIDLGTFKNRAEREEYVERERVVKADIKEGSIPGCTALHLAAANSTAEEVKKLLKKGADVKAEDDEKLNALHYAVLNEREGAKIIPVLIKAGAQVNALDSNDQTLLHWASRWSRREIVQMLIEQKVNVNATNRSGSTALHSGACLGSEGVVQALIQAGAEINARNQSGNTALCDAIHFGSEANFTTLLDAGADATLTYPNGQTLLHAVAVFGTPDMVPQLLGNNLDVNAVDNNGNSSLHYAARYNSLAVVNKLLNSGATAETPNENGNTPLFFACQREREEASINDDTIKIIEALIRDGAKIDTLDRFGGIPLPYAICLGFANDLSNTEELRNSVYKEEPTVCSFGKTLFHYVTSYPEDDALELVKMLYMKSLDINIIDDFGFTALHYAAGLGRLQAVNALILFEAKTEIVDKNGKTPLFYAVICGYTEIVRALLEAWAETSVITASIFNGIDSEDCALELVKNGINIDNNKLDQVWSKKNWSLAKLGKAKGVWKKKLDQFGNSFT